MGTNYYAAAPANKRIHLGKSSVGWQFLAKAEYEWLGDCALSLWLNRVMTSKRIIDEYNNVIDKSDFLAMVFAKQSEPISHTKYIAETYPHSSIHYFDDGGVNFTTCDFS
jgi:hypothetical protein